MVRDPMGNGWFSGIARARRSIGCAAAVAVALVACGGDDDGSFGSPDAGPLPGDAGRRDDGSSPPRDSGADAMTVDAGGDDAAAIGADSGPEDPGPGLGLPICDPRDPASCAEGEGCKAIGGGAGGQFTCRFGGSVALGEPCAGAYAGAFVVDNCEPGLLCSDRGHGAGPRCMRPCGSNGECDAGQRCLLIGRSFPPFARLGVCGPIDDCDVISGGGCATGESCTARLDVEFDPSAMCDAAGSLPEGSACNSPELCATGLACTLAPPDGGFDAAFVPATTAIARCMRSCDVASASDACGEDTTGCVPLAAGGPPSAGVCRIADPEPLGGSRPAAVIVPSAYDGRTPVPLLLALHGTGGSAGAMDYLFQLYRQANRDGFIAVIPNGASNPDGATFWNVAPADCDASEGCPDDVAYLLGLIDEAKERYAIDPARVYVAGNSNGGWMAYRLACDGADRITAIASVPGSGVVDEASCHAARPVSVLEVHGDRDTVIPYDGAAGRLSARESVERWATRAGCDVSMPTDGEPIDLVTTLDGSETTVRRYQTGCADGIDTELWTVTGGDHFFLRSASADLPDRIVGWLLARSR